MTENSPASPPPSQYELARLVKISRNEEKLRDLGLMGDGSSKEVVRKVAGRKRKRENAGDGGGGGGRRSERVAKLLSDDAGCSSSSSSSSSPSSQHPPQNTLPTHLARALSSSSTPSSSGGSWSARQHHQHVSLNKTSTVAATTGCAGYGAVLWKAGGKDEGARKWRVEVLHRGTGGFAVGLAKASWKGPFKSLGSSDNSLGVYHSSGVFKRLGVDKESYAPEYSEGDVVGVEVKVKGKVSEVVFELNGERVGRGRPVNVPAKCAGDYVLAVQPYMGGAARLL